MNPAEHTEVFDGTLVSVDSRVVQSDMHTGSEGGDGLFEDQSDCRSELLDWADMELKLSCDGADGSMTPMTEASWMDDSPTPSSCPGTPDAQMDLPTLHPFNAIDKISASGHIKSVIRRTKETPNVHPMYRDGLIRRKMGPVIFHKSNSQDRLIEELQGKLGIARKERLKKQPDDWLTEGVIVMSNPKRLRDNHSREVDKIIIPPESPITQKKVITSPQASSPNPYLPPSTMEVKPRPTVKPVPAPPPPPPTQTQPGPVLYHIHKESTCPPILTVECKSILVPVNSPAPGLVKSTSIPAQAAATAHPNQSPPPSPVVHPKLLVSVGCQTEYDPLLPPTQIMAQAKVPTTQVNKLDNMLGSLQSDLHKLGVKTVAKGVCGACCKPIIGQVVTAMGRTWHPEHFVCFHCQDEIGSRNFFERDGQPYCERDYHHLFSPRCYYCNGPILDKVVTALDRTWHPEHFFCAQCGAFFGPEGFHEKDGKAYCRKDYFDLFAPKCGGCARAILENYISALNSLWHPECFVCRECFTPFVNGSFFEHDGQPYCEVHYHERRGSLCSGCQKPITGRCITAMGKKFHPEHFVCAFCLKQLNKGTFKEQNDKPYCHGCFIKLFNLPEPAIKGLCKLFCLTLHRYRDAASRHAVLSVIDQLVRSQPDAIATHLPSALLTCGVISKGIMPGRSTASASCCALPWICLIVRVVFSIPEKQMAPYWNKLNPGLVDQFLSSLLGLDQNSSYLPMLAACVEFCTSHNDMITISKHKAAVLDLYLKTVLMSKTRPLQHILAKSDSLLHHVSHAEFKELFLPTLHKALLRSPENSMQTVSSMLSSFSLDLSQYALDIGKCLASQLKTSNLELMTHAAQAMQNLAQQCSDPNAIQDLVTHLFSILAGSEGKLTAVAQKINVLSGIKSCSCHTVSGCSRQSLSSRVVLQFIPFLQQEVHEGTLAHAVSVMSHWMTCLNVEVPAALRDWIKKAFTLKSSTSSVRHAYLQAMIRAFKALCTILQLCERLFLEQSQRLSVIKAQMYQRAIVAVLLCRMYRVRKCAHQSIKKLFSLLGGSSFAHGLLEELCVVINKHKVLPPEALQTEAGEFTELGRTYVPPRILLEALKLCVQQQASGMTLSLSNSALRRVTSEEYAILKTLEGELYDRSIIMSAEQGNAKKGNLRRENKVYSFKEQIIELELKEEIKKKKGIKEEVQLTNKQREMIQNQLEKEAAIRKKLTELDLEVQFTVGILEAIMAHQPPQISHHLPQILNVLLPLLNSPLAAPHVHQTFLHVGTCVLQKQLHFLALLVGHVTLRLLKPECELDPAWCQEDLNVATQRTVQLLHTHTVANREGQTDVRPLSAPAFAFCFPLLQAILSINNSKSEEEKLMQTRALQIIYTHTQLRSCNNANEELIDENGPDLLPRVNMLLLLSKVIGTSTPRLQVLASDCLTALCASAGGQTGCALANQTEINVLLEALLSPCFSVRDAALRGLLELKLALSTDTADPDGLNLLRRLWVARFDVENESRALADNLWQTLCLDLVPELCPLLIKDVTHHEEIIRMAAAEALSTAVGQYQEKSAMVLSHLTELYQQKLYRPAPVLDALGRVIVEAPPDQWDARCGIALALNKLSQWLKKSQVTPIFQFFVPNALNDRHTEVRRCMLDAALSALNTHGKDNVNSLLPVFEEFLKNAPQDASYDSVRQSVVILMGSLAKHLDKSDPKVKPIVAKLITALSTPSQQASITVQESVACCLPPLVPAIKEDASDMVRKLLQLLLESDKYAERKGAAYGLAGLVKGLGILSLKQQDIMTTLTDAIQDKKNARRREGALFAFEMLCNMLGKLFEPYVVHVLPHLLLCFGDGNQYVREAADDCAKAVMRNLSAHGVKLVLPSLLVALEEESWRTKAGSVELLGAMAFCAPKQLSSCLPSIVPKLTEVLTDSHVKVQKAGQQALRQIGSVIRNPEIQAITPILLDALTDPSHKTQHCLHTLLETKFVHFIDAPSLALIMPIVQRAFQDRSTDTRKMAAQIIGNMYSLTDQKDLSPYLPSVIPGLKTSLLDPVPEVRTVSAKALGAMVKGMGESCFDDLLPWLMETLASEQSSVDRSGAAQGLAEVMAGLGVEKLDKLMPDIVQTASKMDIASHVRDGYIMMFIYLPLTFGERFTPYVGPIIPCILKALADENEYVRDTALRGGQRIISMYAETAIALLLPELEQGLFDDLWRIRFSSVQLLGDLLFHISGVSGKMTTETASEDDNFGTAQSNKAIIGALGVERRNRVLSGLYMGRSDIQLVVRQASLHVWKIVVANTPRTLREILPTLFTLLLGFLASTCPDKRTIAARTLGDLVRKLGEKILPEIIPILEEGLCSEKSDERQGVCIGLSEIMKSTSRDAVLVFSESLMPTVRKALCDPLEDVREAAAKTFEQLHTTIGNQALDAILPALLKQLEEPDTAEFALDGLKQVMAVKSRSVLPYLVPKLTAPPVNTRVLAFLSAVTGDALTRHLGVILPALLSSLQEKLGTDKEPQELSSCQTVILSVEDEVGQRIIIEDLLEATRSLDGSLRQASVTMLNSYFSRTRLDYSTHTRLLLSGLVRLLNDPNPKVLHQSWDTINSITKKLDTGSQLALIDDLHKDIRTAAAEIKDEHLPGFCLPKKGVTCILPVLREGVLTGSPEQKKEAAHALGAVIKLTSAEALRPSVVNITGPLIRILGDRFTWTVKTALLETLTFLLCKVGIALKPFLPQLQTTFLKALQDPSRPVRLRAAEALGQLVSIHTKVDPLFTEQLSAIRNTEDSGIRETMLQALRFVIQGAGAKVDHAIKKTMTTMLLGMLGHDEDATRMAAAGCVGLLCAFLSEEELRMVLEHYVLADMLEVDWMVRHGRSMALSIAMKSIPDKLCAPEYSSTVLEVMLSSATADRIPIACSGIRTVGYFMRHQLRSVGDDAVPPRVITQLVKCLQNHSSDIRLVTERVLWWVWKEADTPVLELSLIKPIIKALLDNTKDKNTSVRAQSEHTIVNLLCLRQGDTVMQNVSAILDSASNELLSECYRRSLKKLSGLPDSNEEIDDTILT
ncbi:eIF-2-alpha kinase activator GCN1 [Bagarius yarrelli]|uniref:Paxillin n=2 Tax=Otophysi TaxID=186626 RepID=A0A556VUB5_BAGYA|nr:eIF-2-alpha kinase activator GCN1 [Bagarius yarrelli]